jgi:RNA polymerase primary sigma factor
MPTSATLMSTAREDEETTTHVDELIQRGRGQGYLSLPELRDAFDQARVSPTEARSIIRELTEAGVQLGNERSGTPPSAGNGGEQPAGTGLAAGTGVAADAELPDVDSELAVLTARVVTDTGASAPETDLDDRPRSWVTRCTPT